MITIDRTTPYTNTQLNGTKPVEPLARNAVVEKHSENREARMPIVERRRNQDRRRQRKSKVLLESRSGRDRRKNAHSRRPSIDIKA